MSFILDIETIPQAREILESKMPAELREPVMPDELAQPPAVNWLEKAPEYSMPELSKKVADAELLLDQARKAARPGEPEDAADAVLARWQKEVDALNVKETAAAEKVTTAKTRLADAERKRAEWIATAEQTAAAKLEKARADWKEGTQKARIKFVEDAALSAKLGHAKAIGWRDLRAGVTHIYLWEPEVKQITRVRKWIATLLKHPTLEGVSLFRERGLAIHEFREEKAMLKAFFAGLFAALALQIDMGNARFAGAKMTRREQVISYYGNTFDVPFLYRRAWITGNAVAPFWMRGRYLDDSVFVDLRDRWNMGDREEKSGGLETMAKALGFPGGKTMDGGTFWKWYAEDPVEGVVYLIGDLDMTEFAGEKMGVIVKPDETEEQQEPEE